MPTEKAHRRLSARPPVVQLYFTIRIELTNHFGERRLLKFIRTVSTSVFGRLAPASIF